MDTKIIRVAQPGDTFASPCQEAEGGNTPQKTTVIIQFSIFSFFRISK